MSIARNVSYPLTSFAVAALIGLAGPATISAAGASPTQDDDATVSSEDRIIDLVREDRTLDLERRVVPFDGRSERVEGNDVTVLLDSDVLFEFDEATLSPTAARTLADLSEEMNETMAGDTVTIVGHTDAKGEDAYNQTLSEERAATVRKALEGSLESSPTFAVEGRGATEPVADNELPDGSDNPEGRRRNRRVEITYEAKPPEEG